MRNQRLSSHFLTQFLEINRRSSLNSPPPRTIFVALPPPSDHPHPDEDDDALLLLLRRRHFHLLSWAINMAARPADTVIALKLPTTTITGLDHLGTHELLPQKSNASEHLNDDTSAADAHFQPLQDLCDAKQVHLKFKVANLNLTDRLLLEEVSANKASLLVVTVSAQHSLRHAQRRGSFLFRQIPKGCCVVVVRDYKVLFCKENRPSMAMVGVLDEDDLSKNMMYSKGNNGASTDDDQLSLKKQHPPMNNIVTTTTVAAAPWLRSRASSPEDVLDGSQFLTDSDDESLRRSNCSPRKSLISSALWDIGDDDDDDAPFSAVKNKSPSSVCRESDSHDPTATTTSPSSKSLSRRPSFYRTITSGQCTLRSRIHNLFSFLRPKTLLRGRDRKIRGVDVASTTTNGRWQHFTYEEILEATDRFSPGNLVGKGGHSVVYKGSIGGRLIAVKRLVDDKNCTEQSAEFLTEIGVICQLTSHPNVAPLIGFCIDNGFFLVFDFFERGSLDSWLHGVRVINGSVDPSDDRATAAGHGLTSSSSSSSSAGEELLPTPLSWETRYKIAVGVARGLKYLHSECPRRIIHRDIKSSNILLAHDFEPQITDFGLSKWLPQPCSQLMAPVEGTFGYLAPEYAMDGIVDEKTDVFAFGVLLLELISGRMPVQSLHSNLVSWARPLLETMNAEKLADSRLCGIFNAQEMQSMMITAALCTQRSPHCRPCMTQVLNMLTDDMTAPDGLDSVSVFSSQSMSRQDSFISSDYTSSDYQDDLRRHQELAFEF